MPGVAATEEFGSRPVRGGSPDQNLTVMDGVEIHDPYGFGLTSAFNPKRFSTSNWRLAASAPWRPPVVVAGGREPRGFV
jgi:hypothetical protein